MIEMRDVEDIDQPSRRGRRIVSQARVQHQRTAAALRRRNVHITAFGRQYPRRRGIHLGKKFSLNAAKQHADAPPHRFSAFNDRGQGRRR
jgi:hypothetical protein